MTSEQAEAMTTAIGDAIGSADTVTRADLEASLSALEARLVKWAVGIALAAVALLVVATFLGPLADPRARWPLTAATTWMNSSGASGPATASESVASGLGRGNPIRRKGPDRSVSPGVAGGSGVENGPAAGLRIRGQVFAQDFEVAREVA